MKVKDHHVVFKHDCSSETSLELWRKRVILEHLYFSKNFKIILICIWILKSDYRFIHIDSHHNMNELYAPTKRHRLAGQMKTCACMHFHLPHHSAWHTPVVCNYFILLSWSCSYYGCNCNYLLYFVWLLTVKTDKYLLWLWNYYLISLYHDWSTEK